MENETDIDRVAEIAALGLTVESVFVPFSQSRNKAEKTPSLNWIVTVKCNGRPVLTTDYMAGCGHCSSVKAGKAPSTYRGRDRVLKGVQLGLFRSPTEGERLSDYLDAWRAAECESGYEMEYSLDVFRVKRPCKVILPDPLNVLYCLVSNASVLDYRSFEDWAREMGYDPDSRKGEEVYRACLEIALALRTGLGELGMAKLTTIFQDY